MHDYLADLAEALKAGNSTENTYRPALKALVERIDHKVLATNEPKHVACGAPDFVVTRGTAPLGYIETKDLGDDLKKVERSEQLKRYLEGLGNLILTNYLEFRWYVRGECRLVARLASVQGKHLQIEHDGLNAVRELLKAFLATEAPTITGPTDLATRMAGIARIMHDVIKTALAEEKSEGALHDQMRSFRRVLLPDLTTSDFADMYAQTICYGLFAARMNHSGHGFARESAAFDLPKTNPFLREVFGTIAGPDLDERLVWAVEDLVDVLRRTDIEKILRDFGKQAHGEDRVIPFYETFLAAYNPQLREARGVYYTPQAVVSYIVRSVHAVLQSVFKLPKGLADSSTMRITGPDGAPVDMHKVLILDPAVGTGTFLYEVINQVLAEIRNPGARSNYIREHLLPRMFGFELLMAPYAVAHMKLGLKLREHGYDFKGSDRLGVFLTNTLEQAQKHSSLPLFARAIAEEAAAASRVKQDTPVMVVLGNPPYSGHSQNHGDWIRNLVAHYKKNCPELQKPGQAKWLSDDYVKFIRFAQWRIEQTGHGVLAFVTNNGYLDNPTFRGMRRSLLETFDDIYILDLHGSSKKKELAPDGGRDENVFDIQQGVAIGIFVRRPSRGEATERRVRHAHLWGEREKKYVWLWDHDVDSTKWRSLKCEEPQYLFVPQNSAAKAEYDAGWSLKDIFSEAGDPAPGIVTTHDEFAISWTDREAIQKVRRLLDTRNEAEARQIFRLCSQSQWEYTRAKRELENTDWKKQLVQILYRPFDVRWTVYNRNVAVHRRERVSRHMLDGTNLGLITTRQTRDEWGLLATKGLIGHKAFAGYDINYLFPLYVSPDGELPGVMAHTRGRRSSLNPRFVEELASKLGMTFVPTGSGNRKDRVGPEDVFAYLYAALHSKEYRRRYSEYLKTDFARVPITSKPTLFRALASLGDDLVALHTMQKAPSRTVDFPVAGDNLVEKVEHTPAGRVYINDSQYFDGVPADLWNQRVGGFQVCEKWLTDRMGRRLVFNDVEVYEDIIGVLAATNRCLPKIDDAVDAHGGWPLR